MAKKKVTLKAHQYAIATIILVSNLALFGLLFIFYALGGFLPAELEEILKFLAPIKSIYLTPIVRFILVHKKKGRSDQSGEVNPLYAAVSRIIIYSHIAFVMGFLGLSAFKLITFEFFRNSTTLVEFFYGGYIGLLISDLYNVKESA